MLKWTVISRRDAQKSNGVNPTAATHHLASSAPITPMKPKQERRRSTTATSTCRTPSTQCRRSSTLRSNSLNATDADKENRFTSTPIKSTGESFLPFEALRDVSNLTPNVNDFKGQQQYPVSRKTLSPQHPRKQKKTRPFSTPRHHHKKKKDCIYSHYDFVKFDGQTPNSFRPFETVDSHIEGILSEDPYPKEPMPDLFTPTFSAVHSARSPMKTTHCLDTLNKTSSKKLSIVRLLDMEANSAPPSKKPRADHMNDFLQQVTFVTSPDVKDTCFSRLKINSAGKSVFHSEKVTPLVKRFLDFKFHKSTLLTKNNIVNHNNSSFINNMSLDKIVDAILDTTNYTNNRSTERVMNTSLMVNVESENEKNYSPEKRSRKNKENTNVSENSSDSGFRSSNAENSHQLDHNFMCKCSSKKNKHGNIESEPKNTTIIEINETYNERYVDDDNRNRKRNSSFTDEDRENKKLHLDTTNGDGNFTLKRQKCVRRRKPASVEKNNFVPPIISPFDISELDLDNTDIMSCYLETKEIPGSAVPKITSISTHNGLRRCLTFDSPLNSDSSISESTITSKSDNLEVTGSMDIKMHAENNTLFVNIIRCRDLYRTSGDKINAYVKVALSDRLGDNKRKRSVLLRTAVQGDSSNPHFNNTFKLPIVNHERMLHIEVWHRDRTSKISEFLGCMSFDVKNVIEEGISGSFKLLPQSTGRTSNVLIAPEDRLVCPRTKDVTQKEAKMCESQSSIEELMNLDDLENDLKKSTNRMVLSEQQKYADENLFLRYLELDPTEGPDATSAATQRKATGNRNGRTPFTCTKKLTRAPKSGFGFSVVWTHPPRIERVEKGLPADRAGILPGDYIIFVDKHNVVMMPEIDILNLIRSHGSQLTLEIFRRNPSRNGSVPSVKRLLTPLATSGTLGSTSALPVTSTSNLMQRRPSTVCSTNTVSVDYSRRKLHLPQVTFSSEKATNNPEENRKKAMYQLISKEQQYATCLQFAVSRFVLALAERKDLISPSEHRILFQNCEEILRITEDILDTLVPEDGNPQIHLLVRTYHSKVYEITNAYKRYCSGIKKADCILANKTRNCNSEFSRFLEVPAIPRRRLDFTAFIHKPLEHYREILKQLTIIQSNTKPNHDDFPVINQVVHDLQLTYREITSGAGLMEPVGEGRPLLTVQDLENRLVFTKCKPFVLNKPGRQWIFGGDLSRVEGRNIRQYWTLLFSDLLLFAKASRDRVLFITEDPIPLAHISDLFFNVRKKDTEFRITINPEGKKATSPTVHCGPDLTRTPRKNANKKTVILRAPNAELKAVWQNLLQRQIFQLNSGMDGSSVSSPLESPEAPITSSVATLQSAESLSIRRQQTPQNLNCQNECNKDIQKQIDALIEQKCKLIGKGSLNSKYNAIHLEQWMKAQLKGQATIDTPDMEPVYEDWTEDMLRKRSQELQLIDEEGNLRLRGDIGRKREYNTVEEIILSDHDQSPSKSTTTESQVTVRSSPLMPETVPVCRQCHKTCLGSNGASLKKFSDCSGKNSLKLECSTDDNDNENDDWQSFMLLGVMANPVSSFVKVDPFIPTVPKISVVPATPESSIKNSTNGYQIKDESCQCQTNIQITNNQNIIMKKFNDSFNETDSADNSPQTEEHPYHSLSSSLATLRRYDTVSSLERMASDDPEDIWENNISCKSSDEEPEEEELKESEDEERDWSIDNETFTHSSIRHWTIRAGSYVAEKMAFFERLGEDYRTSGFFHKYLKSSGNVVNGEEQQDEETSGATSGEEIWGTPTSGGELDSSPNSPNYEGKQSPNDGSISSDYGDDTEIMMDELLMTPPISGAMLRGLLPRRTLEPLIEEEGSETSSSSIESTTEPSVSPEQGNGIGDVADTCLTVAEVESLEEKQRNTKVDEATETFPHFTVAEEKEPDIEKEEEMEGVPEAPMATKIHRSESYRRIIEAAEEEVDDEQNAYFFNRFKPIAKFVNIERVPRSKSIKIFEFFNVHKPERKIYESFPENNPNFLKLCSKYDTYPDNFPGAHAEKQMSPKKLKDKQMDKRFWRQLNRRKCSKVKAPA